jgi:excisionase family DNA binding protein
MPSPEDQWVSTGQAARLCSVQRDTVLKWIKRGRLPAIRTAGGHYRISRLDLEPLWTAGAGRRRRAAPENIARTCWEYMAAGGAMRSECRQCLAYHARATYCFRLREHPSLSAGILCWDRLACRDCPYYRRINGLPARVLILSADAAFCRAFEAGIADLDIQVARSPGEAASRMADWWPALVVLDVEAEPGGGPALLARLLADQPTVGCRFLYAVGGAGRPASPEGDVPGAPVVREVCKPFGPADLRQILERL